MKEKESDKMNISKDTFVEILGILENDGCIDSFQFYKNENVIKVYSSRDDAIYHFDNNNNLINPQIFVIQRKIEKLEKEKNNLENQLKLLTNN